jgi:hypothetical protein
MAAVERARLGRAGSKFSFHIESGQPEPGVGTGDAKHEIVIGVSKCQKMKTLIVPEIVSTIGAPMGEMLPVPSSSFRTL